MTELQMVVRIIPSEQRRVRGTAYSSIKLVKEQRSKREGK